MSERKAIFLDRDGVINKLILESGISRSPRLIEEFIINSEIPHFIATFKNLGYLILVITNQPEVSRGLVSKEQVEEFHRLIFDLLVIDDIFVCWHDKDDECSCRKPKPGLLIEAKQKYDIDMVNSFFIGDRTIDFDAAKAAGTNGILYTESTVFKWNEAFNSLTGIMNYILKKSVL